MLKLTLRNVVFLLLPLVLAIGTASGIRFRPELDDWLSDRDSLIAGIEEKSPPFGFIDRRGEPDGFNIDIARLLEDIAEKKISFFYAPHSELISALDSGRIDFIIGIDKTAKLSERLVFLERVLYNEYILYIPQGSKQPSGMSDLDSLRIGYKKDSPVSDILLETPEIIAIEFDSDSLGLDKVTRKEIDGYISSILICDYIILLNKWSNKIASSHSIVFKYDYTIALPESSPELKSILETSLSRMLVSSEFKEIQAKWFGGAETRIVNQPTSWIFLGFTLVFVLILIFFAHSRAQALFSLRLEAKKNDALMKKISELNILKNTFFKAADNGNIGIFTLSDEDGIEAKFIDVNGAMTDITGFDESALLKMSFMGIFEGEDRDKVIERYRLRRGGEVQPESYDIESVRADGERIPIELFVKTIQTSDKLLTIGIMRDISRLRTLQDKLSRSDQNFREMLSGLPQGAVVLNKERIIYLNNAFRKLVGKAPEEIRAFGIEKLISPAHRSKVERVIDNLLSGREAPKEMDIELIGPRNDLILTSTRLRPIDYFGEKAAILIFENLSEEERLRKRLGIENRVEGLGKITEHVVLEYNNTLMGILGAISHLRDEIGDDVNLAEYIDIVEKDAERAAVLTQKLLNFSKDTENRPGDILSIHKVIRDALALTPGNDHPAISVKTELEARPDTIFGNLSQIHQAVLNLIVNAVEAMGEKGELCVKTSNFKSDSSFLANHPEAQNTRYIRIDFIDNGPGIPANLLENIFEPFFTTKEFGAGAGLGLSLVYKVAKRHRGFVDVESEKGKGSKFTLYLPEEIQEAAEVDDSKNLPIGNETILVIDDEPHIRTILKALLTKLGYEVLLASEGREAIEIVKSKHGQIDLILLDVVMPGMSGLDVFEAIKTLQPNSKVIISTGYAKEETVSDMIRNGAEALVRKPYRAATISRAIRQVLDAGGAVEEGRGND